MLDKNTEQKIIEAIYQKPRTIQEIAFIIDKNWRTADSYVEKIAQETGAIETRTFREGTKGALKLVFWKNIEMLHSSDFQRRLYKSIVSKTRDDDFSPFDIYQYVDEKSRNAFADEIEEDKTINQNLTGILRSTEKQLLCFCGNPTWIFLEENGKQMIKIIEELVANGVTIKILARVDMGSRHNIEKLEEINEKLGKEVIEIRHTEQPLRGFIIDNKLARFAEERKQKAQKGAALKKKISTLYEIKDDQWVDWLQRVFWKVFRASIDGRKRLKDLGTIERIKF